MIDACMYACMKIFSSKEMACENLIELQADFLSFTSKRMWWWKESKSAKPKRHSFETETASAFISPLHTRHTAPQSGEVRTPLPDSYPSHWLTRDLYVKTTADEYRGRISPFCTYRESMYRVNFACASQVMYKRIKNPWTPVNLISANPYAQSSPCRKLSNRHIGELRMKKLRSMRV